ncbi:MAG: hypothetical protein GX922_08090 [Firmicutes bacterium]|nr:hypothetical protein [Bacillota bacterium]
MNGRKKVLDALGFSINKKGLPWDVLVIRRPQEITEDAKIIFKKGYRYLDPWETASFPIEGPGRSHYQYLKIS